MESATGRRLSRNRFTRHVKMPRPLSDSPPDTPHGGQDRRKVRHHDFLQFRREKSQRAVEIALGHSSPLPHDIATKIPAFLADEYHEAQKINSEKKVVECLDRQDDVWRDAHMFNQVREVI
jgi:hypothetical protein